MIQAARRPSLVVVGTGMAGAKVVEEVLLRAPDRYNIRMFGAEPHGTYNRILPSTVLGGFQDPAQLWINPLDWYEKRGVQVHPGSKGCSSFAPLTTAGRSALTPRIASGRWSSAAACLGWRPPAVCSRTAWT